MGNPASPNAWGTLIAHAIRKGVIVATGTYRAMKAVDSHALQNTRLHIRPKLNLKQSAATQCENFNVGMGVECIIDGVEC